MVSGLVISFAWRHSSPSISQSPDGWGLTEKLLPETLSLNLIKQITCIFQTEVIGKYFKDSEIYRVDHYLAKSVTKHILQFRYETYILRFLFSMSGINQIKGLHTSDLIFQTDK